MDIVLSAWRELDTCRQLGWSVGPIPWTALDAWTRALGMDDEASLLITQVIRKLDGDYLGAIAAKQRLNNTTE